MFKILLAEDEDSLRKLIAKSLINAGYTVVEAPDGKLALELFSNEHFDIVITDVMMPHMDGNELSKKIREINTDIPILMLTALESFEDKEKGFSSGTDNYLVKPIAMKELLLHIKALLRRYKITYENKIELSETVLQWSSNTVKFRGQNIELTKKEFLLLYKLLSNSNIIFTRDQLIDEIWGYDNESSDRTVDTHIKWLRDKVPSKDFQIVTIRGLGYKAVVYEKD